MAERTEKFPVRGMSCEHCVRAVQSALGAIAGVKQARVSLEENAATVTYDDSQVSRQQLKDTIEEEGYGADI